jgi:hypothetical protein
MPAGRTSSGHRDQSQSHLCLLQQARSTWIADQLRHYERGVRLSYAI